MIFKNRLMIGLVGFTLLQAAPTAPSGCSCQNKSETTTKKTISYKGNGGYKEAYQLGELSRASGGTSDPKTFVQRYNQELGREVLRAEPYFIDGYNDGYNSRPSQY